MRICAAQGPGHGCCYCRWAHWPSTTSASRSRRTCWRRAELRPSTPDRSTRRRFPRRLSRPGAWTAPLFARPPRSAGPVDETAMPAATEQAGGLDTAVICGTDARYSTEVAGVVEVAHAAGISTIYLAGPQKAVADLDKSHLPDDYLIATIDAVHALSKLLGRLGA